MNRYIKTDVRYLYGCMVLACLQGGILLFLDASMRKSLGVFLVAYIILVGICAARTFKERKRIQNIIQNGRHQRGTVCNLCKLSQEYSIGRFGSNLTRTVYRIKAEVLDEFGGRTIYYSDLLSGRKRKYIPKEVDIYYDSGLSYILWEKMSGKIVHTVEELNETEQGETFRMVLSYVNGLLVIGMVLAGIAMIYISQNC